MAFERGADELDLLVGQMLDSDELRNVLTPKPTYTEDERDWFYKVMAYLAAWLARSAAQPKTAI